MSFKIRKQRSRSIFTAPSRDLVVELEVELARFKEEIDRLTKLLNKEIQLNKQSQNYVQVTKGKFQKVVEVDSQNFDLKQTIISLQNENMKLSADLKLILFKLERTEHFLKEFRQKKNLSVSSFTDQNFMSSNNERNLILRIKQKDNKINHLINTMKTQIPPSNDHLETGNKPQEELTYIFYRLRCQLVGMKIPIDNFFQDLMQDKGIDDKINIFRVRQNFKRSQYKFKDIDDKDAEILLQYLFCEQVVVNKEILIQRFQQFIRPSYKDLFINKKAINNKEQMKIITDVLYTIQFKQIYLFKEELSQKIETNIMNVTQYLDILYSTQLFLKPLQKEIYEYALLSATYPSFKEFSLETALNPFKSLQSDNYISSQNYIS